MEPTGLWLCTSSSQCSRWVSEAFCRSQQDSAGGPALRAGTCPFVRAQHEGVPEGVGVTGSLRDCGWERRKGALRARCAGWQLVTTPPLSLLCCSSCPLPVPTPLWARGKQACDGAVQEGWASRCPQSACGPPATSCSR